MPARRCPRCRRLRGDDALSSDRLNDLVRFYSILDQLEKNIGGARRLPDCRRLMDWPKRGVYFFRESGENRADSGEGPRIVTVGTHALKAGARTPLWRRLSQHKGQRRSGCGNHRGSIFRLLVGVALARRHGYDYPTCGDKKADRREVKKHEHVLECEVGRVIGDFSFLWIAVEDEPGRTACAGASRRIRSRAEQFRQATARSYVATLARLLLRQGAREQRRSLELQSRRRSQAGHFRGRSPIHSDRKRMHIRPAGQSVRQRKFVEGGTARIQQ